MVLRSGFDFGGQRKVDLAAFAHEPADARSACIAVITAARDVRQEVASYRSLGAPVVIVLMPEALQLWNWQQGDVPAEPVEHVPAARAADFFRSRRKDFAPDAIYRAKTWGRLERQFQLSFVDAGLMPLVEREAGERLKSLIERVFQGLKRTLWPKKAELSDDDGHWLLRSAFWLLAARILKDKQVPNFTSLDLLQVEDVFGRVARHYDSGQADLAASRIRSSRERAALESAAQEVDRFSHLGNVTTESLAYVYESTLIDKETRAKLGTHSTPPYLVDYVVWKMAPWINEIPVDERDVLEPACGHAAFLVAAMRLLKELLPAARQGERKQYLRKHLHGIEVDSFAVEIARLSLTLADIPNPNGWDLRWEDMFSGSSLATRAKQATILLGNPPFEDFSALDRNVYARKGVQLRYVNKTAETLGRVLPALRPGGVFGFVVPQGLLHSKNADTLRKQICEGFEISEICLFPDRVFSFSDAESAVIIGRRTTSPCRGRLTSYRRVREPDMDRFKLDYAVTSRQAIPQDVVCSPPSWNLRLPDLHEVWQALQGCPVLGGYADLGQGLFYLNADKIPPRQQTISQHRFAGAVERLAKFNSDVMLHALPETVWMNLDDAVIDRRVTGASTGIPQVLLNYAPVSRGPWRLKALIDRAGHAVTSRFITVRPQDHTVPLEYLWAVLNSPLANAYVYAHSMKRDVLVGMMRAMPVPDTSEADRQRVAALAVAYLDEVSRHDLPLGNVVNGSTGRRLLMAMDAEVLRLYQLSPRLERQVLDLFASQQRVGVPFRFDGYFPDDFEPWIPLHEYLSEEYRRSTAGALRASHEDVSSPELLEALRRASEDFKE